MPEGLPVVACVRVNSASVSKRLRYPATARNREVILEVLRDVLPAEGLVLELASGSGEHAVTFAAALPKLRWQPTDPELAARESIAAWTEHEGLGNEGRQVDRTRTVATHALFRWFWWNMNYHSEHHAWASIPWHQLPAAYGEVRDRLPHLERGYLGFLGRNLNSMSASPSASDGATVSAK